MFSKRLVLPVFFSVCAVIFLGAHLNSSIVDYSGYYSQTKYNSGDSLTWAAPGYNDSHWKTGAPVVAADNWWLRTQIKTNSRPGGNKHAGLTISIQGSYQLFWDGYYIGENGKWAAGRATEVEGQRINYFLLPDSLTKDSTHTVALRLASFKDPKRNVFPSLIVGDYFQLARAELKFAVPLHIIAGIFLVIAVYYFFIYFISFRHLPYLLFGFLCFCFFSMIMMEYMRSYYLYPYSFHFKRLFIIAALAILAGNLLAFFLLVYFRLRNRLPVMILLNTLLAFICYSNTSFDNATKGISLVSFTFALLICLFAIIKNKPGSQEPFYGVLACLSCHVKYDLMIYIGFCVMVLFMLVSLSKQMRMQIKSQQEALLRSNRFEIELLKKNIQPHFLMNSLTSLMEWIERSPAVGIEFIHALAEEFRILTEISSLQLVPVKQELDLCRSHVKIMSFRKDIRFELEAINIPDEEMIPPAVLLTIIENGISHNIHQGNQTIFTISFKRLPDQWSYTVYAPGEVKKTNDARKGTGLQYIEVRLEESYPGKWQLQSGQVAGGWQTLIIINN